MPDEIVVVPAATPEAKAEKLEKELGVSPTGTAIIPAKVVPYLLAVLAVLGALIGMGVGEHPVLPALAPAEGYLQAAAAVITALLGLTPGLRRAVVVLLCLGAISMSGCAWWQKTGPKLATCAVKAVSDQVPALVPVLDDMTKHNAGGDLKDRVGALATTAGIDAVFCALQVLFASITDEISKAEVMGGGPDVDLYLLREQRGRVDGLRAALSVER
jgi:hypothetical protein